MSLGKHPIGAHIFKFGVTEGYFLSILIMVCCVYMYSLESSNDEAIIMRTNNMLHVKENRKSIPIICHLIWRYD